MERSVQLQGLYAFQFTTFKFIHPPFLTKLGTFYIILSYYVLSLTINLAKESEQ